MSLRARLTRLEQMAERSRPVARPTVDLDAICKKLERFGLAERDDDGRWHPTDYRLLKALLAERRAGRAGLRTGR